MHPYFKRYGIQIPSCISNVRDATYCLRELIFKPEIVFDFFETLDVPLVSFHTFNKMMEYKTIIAKITGLQQVQIARRLGWITRNTDSRHVKTDFNTFCLFFIYT